jgi:hypothetical protein
VTVIVPLVDGRPLVHEPPHHPHAARVRGEHQRRIAMSLLGIEKARILPHEPLHLTHVAPPGSLAPRWHPLRLTLHAHSHGLGQAPLLPTLTLSQPRIQRLVRARRKFGRAF